jgi:hypothetical protein
MKKILFSALLLGAALTLSAQQTSSNGNVSSQKFGLSVAYFGNKFTEAGAQIGLERYWATTPNFRVIGSLQASAFGKKDLYKAVSINPRVGVRYTSNWGLTAEWHLGLGYQHRFFDYDQFLIDDEGNIVQKGKAGQSSAMPNIAFGLGYDFSRISNLPANLYLRPGFYWTYPNQHFGFEASYALEAGLVFRL